MLVSWCGDWQITPAVDHARSRYEIIWSYINFVRVPCAASFNSTAMLFFTAVYLEKAVFSPHLLDSFPRVRYK